MSLEGVELSKKFKLRTDLFHHTHEVWGPCSYKNTPLWRRGLRVLESYCGFPPFIPHFSPLRPSLACHNREKTREERAGHALSLVPRDLYNTNEAIRTSYSK